MNHYRYYISLLRRLPPAVTRRIIRKTCHSYSTMAPYLTGKYGLEIGGPSGIFCSGHLIPVYSLCRGIDTCNFSAQTIWSEPTNLLKFGPRPGKQFVAEASDLSMVPDETYDFVLASHVLEHIANPLRALQEWKRVLNPEGTVLVVVPDKRETFDHRRAFTPFDHIEADFIANTPEDDLTHLDEVLSLHDLALDPPAGSRQQFRERCLRNHSLRAMHHHVFGTETLALMFGRLQMRVVTATIENPYHIVAFAQKADPAVHKLEGLHNLRFRTSGLADNVARAKGSN